MAYWPAADHSRGDDVQVQKHACSLAYLCPGRCSSMQLCKVRSHFITRPHLDLPHSGLALAHLTALVCQRSSVCCCCSLGHTAALQRRSLGRWPPSSCCSHLSGFAPCCLRATRRPTNSSPVRPPVQPNGSDGDRFSQACDMMPLFCHAAGLFLISQVCSS